MDAPYQSPFLFFLNRQVFSFFKKKIMKLKLLSYQIYILHATKVRNKCLNGGSLPTSVFSLIKKKQSILTTTQAPVIQIKTGLRSCSREDLPSFPWLHVLSCLRKLTNFLSQKCSFLSYVQEENETLNFKQSDQDYNCNFLYLIHLLAHRKITVQGHSSQVTLNIYIDVAHLLLR